MAQNAHLEWVFMQDNALTHNARATRTALQEMGITQLIWPPLSLDLNPIEHVWKWMKDWLEKRPVTSIAALKLQVREAWEAVLEEFLLKLIKSMPKRMKRVIEANGGNTKY
jgi:transposase